MKTVNAVLLGTILFSANAYSKTFTFRNAQTNQVMSVYCFNPQSIQCQTKKEEVRQRLIQNTNPNQTSLSGARAEDTRLKITRDFTNAGKRVQQGASDAAKATRDTVSDTATRVADATSNTFNRVKAGTVDAIDRLRQGASQSFDRLRVGTRNTLEEAKEGTANTIDNVKDGASDVSDRVASSVDKGMQPVRRAGDALLDAAHSATGTLQNGLNRMSANSCKRKLERHARDFKNKYERTGEQSLVSYEDKMIYIREKLIEEGRLDDCSTHFEHAVLGYQLEWISGKGLVASDTHIFDGHGRTPSGQVGYWKNEQRAGLEEFHQNAVSR